MAHQNRQGHRHHDRAILRQKQRRQNAFHPTATFSEDPVNGFSSVTAIIASSPALTSQSAVVTSSPAVTSQPVSTSSPQDSSSSSDTAASSAVSSSISTSSTAISTSQSTDSVATTTTDSITSPSVVSLASSTSSASVVQDPNVTTAPSSTIGSRTSALLNGKQTKSFNTIMYTQSGTATPGGATSQSTGTIVGIVAGVIVGIVAIGFIASYMIRRRTRNRDQAFNRNSFMRQSRAIPDDFNAPRPNIGSSNALALARANMNLSDPPSPPAHMTGGPPQMGYNNASPVSFQPGQIISSGNAYGNPNAYQPPAEYHQTQLTRQPSTATYLTREPSGRSPYPGAPPRPSPANNFDHNEMRAPNSHDFPIPPAPAAFHEEGRGGVASITPFQQQQYAEIGRQLNHPPIAGLGARSMPSPGAESYGNSPFDDPTAAGFDGQRPRGAATTPPPQYPSPTLHPQEQAQRDGALSRTLSTTYANLSARSATSTEPTRSGTPTDANPQQTYHHPSPSISPASPPFNGVGTTSYPELSSALSSPMSASFVQVHGRDSQRGVVGEVPAGRLVVHDGEKVARRDTVYDDDDIYGGI